MIVIQGVVHESPLSSGADKSEGAQDAKLMRDGRFTGTNGGRQIADAQRAIDQRGHDPQPGGIA